MAEIWFLKVWRKLQKMSRSFWKDVCTSCNCTFWKDKRWDFDVKNWPSDLTSKIWNNKWISKCDLLSAWNGERGHPEVWIFGYHQICRWHRSVTRGVEPTAGVTLRECVHCCCLPLEINVLHCIPWSGSWTSHCSYRCLWRQAVEWDLGHCISGLLGPQKFPGQFKYGTFILGPGQPRDAEPQLRPHSPAHLHKYLQRSSGSGAMIGQLRSVLGQITSTSLHCFIKVDQAGKGCVCWDSVCTAGA